MKVPIHSILEICRRIAGIGTAAALFLGPIAPAFAENNNHDHDGLQRLRHIIVIYQENWSFDSLYGQFPGASGYAYGFDTLPQYDARALPAYSSLIPKTPRPLKGPPDPQFPASPDGNLALWTNHNVALPLIPYDFTNYINGDARTGDIVHRFYHEQLQIDNGLLEPKISDLGKFVTWSDNPGLVLSYLDATELPEGRLAQQYTLCDNFFHSAYGGSFLNHQWLIAANTPRWTTAIPAGWVSSYNPTTKTLADAQLSVDGQYAVNTIQPLLAPFSPGTPTTKRLLINNTDPSAPGYLPNIGNRLDDAGISWKWYTGGWNEALQNNAQAATDPNTLFQFHHQPFAYYTKYAPFLTAPSADYTSTPPLNPATTGPNSHLQDETQFLADLHANRLPAVTFIKPAGVDNEHPGYAGEVTGQQHVADLLSAIQHSSAWRDCAIVITYDENGGRWDHVPPPVRADHWGVGVRVPGIIISPFAREGYVDHHEYETVSILKLMEKRFHLPPLGTRDADPAVSDLTTALSFRESDR
ncbi:MAG: alkaline phosphatase family protein [Chloroflexota bacterium]|nr:alkaline phosphatase family protein [Verrucomicrobiota bacterium]MDQ6908763.1 alkaline phosphatase family protein [Chloroflexota bacterium]